MSAEPLARRDVDTSRVLYPVIVNLQGSGESQRKRVHAAVAEYLTAIGEDEETAELAASLYVAERPWPATVRVVALTRDGLARIATRATHATKENS